MLSGEFMNSNKTLTIVGVGPGGNASRKDITKAVNKDLPMAVFDEKCF
jgi:hypothetical protein